MARGNYIRIETRCVGMQHRLKQSARSMLLNYLPFWVKLVREPNNENDENAIKVIVDDPNLEPWKGNHLGYVPRQVARELAPRLDAREVVFHSAVITSLDLSSGEGDLTMRLRKRRAKKTRPR